MLVIWIWSLLLNRLHFFLLVSVFLNGREYKGEAPGSFIGLDLTENMYIGAVPDFRRISRLAGYTKGFVGQRPLSFALYL